MGRRVRLRTDLTLDLYDRYGRLRAYATPVGKPDLGLSQIQAGWSDAYVFEDEFARYDQYDDAAEAAQDANNGAWALCAGHFHQPVAP